jgi:2-polyprenyl-3-methyl-5-hydroxy-6-metoxy-1,4-benzoquinol methylase
MEAYKQYFDSNRTLWNNKTAVHKNSEFYGLDAFLQGSSTLNDIELKEMGDVSGKKILHLQCHFGLDTLSWARMGAEVTGVDFSEAAIQEAKEIAEQISIQANFIQANIYDLPSILDEKFDIVFTSYGVIGWLPDLQLWASVIDKFLKPGGFFYMAEFHPVVWMLDEEFTHVKYYYHNQELIEIEMEGTYADKEADLKGKEYSWNHSISEVLNALLSKNFELKFFNEYSYSPYDCFKNMVKGSDGNYRVKGLEDKIPMVYSLKAVKK